MRACSILFTTTLVTLLAGCEPSAGSRPPQSAGPLPASDLFPRPLVDGQASFGEVTHGRVALVDFWATWCEGCTESIPRVRHLAETYASEDLVVIGINVGEESASVVRYADEARMRYPQFVDPEFAFADAIGAREVPTMFVLDRSGQIVHRARDLDQDLLEHLERALAAR